MTPLGGSTFNVTVQHICFFDSFLILFDVKLMTNVGLENEHGEMPCDWQKVHKSPKRDHECTYYVQ